MVSEVPMVEDKVPSTSTEASKPVTVALLSKVTVIPLGIITASVVKLNDGEVPPTQVAPLLQFPDSVAVYVNALTGRHSNIIAASNSPVFILVISKSVRFIKLV
jgi:hypothetical protein